MNIYIGKNIALALGCMLCLGGCVSQSPTISHTHIGHAMTGWLDTPDKKGLLVTAENAAQDALQAADRALNKSSDLSSIKIDVANVIQATKLDEGNRDDAQYTVFSALSNAVSHIEFAHNSADASDNVKSSANSIGVHAQYILERCDLILALGKEILVSASIDEVRLLSRELYKLADANVNGEDLNGDGIVGTLPAEFGLKQLRTQIQAMIDREIPPYRTVDSWYLFNLVRLPNGDWFFRRSNNDSSIYSSY